MDTQRGLYEKFRVWRVDGQSEQGEKHAMCDYFVLDLTHDPFAIPAIQAYVESCKDRFPNLAADLREKYLKEQDQNGSLNREGLTLFTDNET